MERNPTNGELAIMLTDMKVNDEAAHNNLLSSLVELKTYVIQTNGRVRKLEQWKYILIGGIAVVNIIFVPVIINLITKKLYA